MGTSSDPSTTSSGRSTGGLETSSEELAQMQSLELQGRTNCSLTTVDSKTAEKENFALEIPTFADREQACLVLRALVGTTITLAGSLKMRRFGTTSGTGSTQGTT